MKQDNIHPRIPVPNTPPYKSNSIPISTTLNHTTHQHTLPNTVSIDSDGVVGIYEYSLTDTTIISLRTSISNGNSISINEVGDVCPPPLPDSQYKAYVKHLKSNIWRRKRAKAIKRDEGRCRCCGSTIRLTVHHIIYKGVVFVEPIDCLITLCHKCHNEVHGRTGDSFISTMNANKSQTKIEGTK